MRAPPVQPEARTWAAPAQAERRRAGPGTAGGTAAAQAPAHTEGGRRRDTEGTAAAPRPAAAGAAARTEDTAEAAARRSVPVAGRPGAAVVEHTAGTAEARPAAVGTGRELLAAAVGTSSVPAQAAAATWKAVGTHPTALSPEKTQNKIKNNSSSRLIVLTKLLYLAIKSMFLCQFPILALQSSFLQLLLQARPSHLHVENVCVHHIERQRATPEELLLILQNTSFEIVE